MRGSARKEYINKLNSLNEFDRLVENLCSGEFTLTHIELAYAAYINKAKHIPEGVKNLLTPIADNNRGLLTHCWKMIKQTVGICELAYRRGMQDEGVTDGDSQTKGLKKTPSQSRKKKDLYKSY